MGWQDPSPRARARSPAGNPAAQPGYGDPGVRLSFMAIMGRAVVALLVGGVAYAGVHHGFRAWLAPSHATALLALSVASAVAVGGLVLRALMRLPPSGSRRGRGDDSGLGFEVSDVGDAVGAVVGVVGAIVDAATD